MRFIPSLLAFVLLAVGSTRAAVVQISPIPGTYPVSLSTDWYTNVGPEMRFDGNGSFWYRETVEYLGFSSGGNFLGGYDLGPSLLTLEVIGPQTQWRTLFPQAQAVSVHKVEDRMRPLPIGGTYTVDNVTQVMSGRYAIRVNAQDGVHYGWLQFDSSQPWDRFDAYRTTGVTAFLEQIPNTPVPVPEPGSAALVAVLTVAFCRRRRRAGIC